MTVLTIALMATGMHKPVMASNEIITKCLSKYSESTSGIGEFVMTQSANGKKVSIKTELQYERPSKIFLHQSSEAVAPNDWLVVSDGVNFGYDVPGARPDQRRRLYEPVTSAPNISREQTTLKVHHIYMAAKRSLGDAPNPFLEFVTQSAAENQSLKGYLARFKKIDAEAKEKELVDGTTGYSIGGTIWLGDPLMGADGKPTGQFDSQGRYELQISKDYDLVSMKIIETMAITDKSSNLPTQINIVTVWSGKVQLNQKPADAIFKVR